MGKVLANFLLLFLIPPKVASLELTQDQLQSLQGAPKFPLSLNVVVNMKYVVDIGESLGQATFYFYVEVHRFEPRLLSILPQPANGSTECFLLGKGKFPARFDFMFTLNAIKQQCHPGLNSDTFLCTDGWLVAGRFCQVTVAADFSDVGHFPFDSHRMPVYVSHWLAGERFVNITTPTACELKLKGLKGSKGKVLVENQDWVVDDYNCSKIVSLYPGNRVSGRYPLI